jgi:hypothetical protein
VRTTSNQRLAREKGAYAIQFAGFGGIMDRMVLARGRRHEPSRLVDHLRGIIATMLRQAHRISIIRSLRL